MSAETQTSGPPEYPDQREVLYETEKQCPVCGETFKTMKVRSRLTRIRQDADFCTYFKETNPYYYSICVCNHCGFAAPDNSFSDISDSDAIKLKKYLQEKNLRVDFTSVRDWRQAMATYKLAVFFSEMMNVMPSRLAQIYMKMAWLHREAGSWDEEKEALRKAAEYWDKATRREKFPIANLSETVIMYIIGEALRRIGEYEQALLFLSKVVFKRSTDEKQIIELAKEAWNAAKEAKKNAEDGGGQLIEGVVTSGQGLATARQAGQRPAGDKIDEGKLDEIIATAGKTAPKPEPEAEPAASQPQRPQRHGKLIFVVGQPLYLRLLVEDALAALRRPDFTVVAFSGYDRLAALLAAIMPDAVVVVGSVPMALQAAIGDAVRKNSVNYGMLAVAVTDWEWERGSLISFEKTWAVPFRGNLMAGQIMQRLLEMEIGK
ncbi:MAG: DUF2225 domain-containing protein [Negativicutes bacterium]|nr:DUF2225 domain-containing protein [Negativicutes bacterium]